MARLFNWVYKITVVGRPTGFIGSNPGFFETIGNALEFSNVTSDGPRMSFDVKKSLGKEPNTCKIVLDNLADTTRAALERLPLALTLQAGYAETGPRTLFVGDVTRSNTALKGTNNETTLVVADGGRALANARHTASYKAGTPILKIVQDAAVTMGLKVPTVVMSDPQLKQTIPVGMSLDGATRDMLTDVLAPYGYNFSIQNGRLQVLKDGQLQPGASFLIDEAAGLIGSPQRSTPDKPKGKSELSIEMLLYPELFPAAPITLHSKFHNGEFRIKELTGRGDTYGNDWKTTLKCT